MEKDSRMKLYLKIYKYNRFIGTLQIDPYLSCIKMHILYSSHIEYQWKFFVNHNKQEKEVIKNEK